MRSMILALGFLALAALPAHADEDDVARAARWDALKHTMFGNRPVEDGAGVVQLDAPPRALDAALVPVTVTLTDEKPLKALYLLIDDNPSPLAGTFHFGPAADPQLLKTRVRVDQYTFIHAVAETADGHLYVATRFVKAAGGCSAPATQDLRLALERIGRMKLHVRGVPEQGRPIQTELMISHPNANGMQMDQVTRNYTPARFIQTVKVTYNDTLVFDLDSDISLSEDPVITFLLVPQAKQGKLTVLAEDSTKTAFHKSFEIPQDE
jgi:sulfur-oxidizing protein SoxY